MHIRMYLTQTSKRGRFENGENGRNDVTERFSRYARRNGTTGFSNEIESFSMSPRRS